MNRTRPPDIELGLAEALMLDASNQATLGDKNLRINGIDRNHALFRKQCKSSLTVAEEIDQRSDRMLAGGVPPTQLLA